jgi:hypothetical protein
MLRRRNSDLHCSAIRLSLFDAVLLAPVIALPLLFVVSLALASMMMRTGRHRRGCRSSPSWATWRAASGATRGSRS